jgi:antitoxin YefM
MLDREISYSQARAHLAELLDRVSDGKEIVTITRRNQSSVALISADELSSLLESVYLLRSPANAKRLFSALEWAQSEQAVPQTLAQLKAELQIES